MRGQIDEQIGLQILTLVFSIMVPTHTETHNTAEATTAQKNLQYAMATQGVHGFSKCVQLQGIKHTLQTDKGRIGCLNRAWPHSLQPPAQEIRASSP